MNNSWKKILKKYLSLFLSKNQANIWVNRVNFYKKQITSFYEDMLFKNEERELVVKQVFTDKIKELLDKRKEGTIKKYEENYLFLLHKNIVLKFVLKYRWPKCFFYRWFLWNLEFDKSEEEKEITKEENKKIKRPFIISPEVKKQIEEEQRLKEHHEILKKNFKYGNYLIWTKRQRHFFHMLSPKVFHDFPFWLSFSVFFFFYEFVNFLHFKSTSFIPLHYCLSLLIFVSLWWFIQIAEESEEHHTIYVESFILDGFLLFILSEIMFFFAFFWAFFSSSISPTIWLYYLWPPLGINVIYPFKLPLINTGLLLYSGWTVTWSHKSLMEGKISNALEGLLWTLFFAILFTFVQIYEYTYACFSIYDGIYGSVFYLLTGFHGFHVFLGSIMLFICLCRMYGGTLSKWIHNGFETSIWYWHFVDVVWLFLFLFVYWWGNYSVSSSIN